MKKAIVIMLTGAMMLAAVACGGGSSSMRRRQQQFCPRSGIKDRRGETCRRNTGNGREHSGRARAD